MNHIQLWVVNSWQGWWLCHSFTIFLLMSVLLILCRLVSLFAINLFQYVLLASCIFVPSSLRGVLFWVHVKPVRTHLVLCSTKTYPITISIRKFELLKYGPKLLRFIYIARPPSGDVPSDINLFL